MKPLLSVALLAAFLCGCVANTESQRDRMLIGAGLGAASGAIVGGAVGSGAGATLAGATIGALGGGIIGVMTTPRNCIARDEQGVPYKVRCP